MRKYEKKVKKIIPHDLKNLIQKYFTDHIDDIGNLDYDQLKEYFGNLKKQLDEGMLKQFTISFQSKNKIDIFFPREIIDECIYREIIVKKVYGFNNKRLPDFHYKQGYIYDIDIDFDEDEKLHYDGGYEYVQTLCNTYSNVRVHDFKWEKPFLEKVFDKSYLDSLHSGDFLLITLNNENKILRKLYKLEWCSNLRLLFDPDYDETMCLSYIKSIYKIKLDTRLLQDRCK